MNFLAFSEALGIPRSLLLPVLRISLLPIRNHLDSGSLVPLISRGEFSRTWNLGTVIIVQVFFPQIIVFHYTSSRFLEQFLKENKQVRRIKLNSIDIPASPGIFKQSMGLGTEEE
jgi:hypothetical protein